MRMPIYLLFVYTVETSLCYGRLASRGVGGRARFRAALQYGAIRLFLGRAILALLSDFALQNAAEGLLFAVFVPIRWLEWSLTDVLIVKRTPVSLTSYLVADRRANVWRVVGVTASCLVDFWGLLLGLRVSELWV